MKKKSLIIAAIIIVFLILILIFVFFKNNSNSINNTIMKSEYGFKLNKTISKGTKVNNYTYKADYYHYSNDNINIFLYDYENKAEVKNEMEILKEERKNESNEYEYTEKETHIELNLCHEDTCIKNIAFDNYLISFHYPNKEKYIKQVELLIQKLIQK